MHKRLILICLLNFSVFLGLGVVLGQTETPQPTEESSTLVPSSTIIVTPPEYYPEYLICDEIEENEGPRWLDVENGVSSVDDLMLTLDQMGEYEIRLVEGKYVNIGRVENESTSPPNNFLHAPSYIDACLSEDNTISSLGIKSGTITQNVDNQLDIYDFVALYGLPDEITWTVRPLDRIVFWFEAGIAVTTYVGPETEFQYTVHEIYYYPFVDGTAYENEYPFAYTRLEALSSIEQNPFDFENIVATVTAQPTRTPTPTLIPIATETP